MLCRQGGDGESDGNNLSAWRVYNVVAWRDNGASCCASRGLDRIVPAGRGRREMHGVRASHHIVPCSLAGTIRCMALTVHGVLRPRQQGGAGDESEAGGEGAPSEGGWKLTISGRFAHKRCCFFCTLVRGPNSSLCLKYEPASELRSRLRVFRR